MNRNKRIPNNGKNGNKLKRRDWMTSNKKLKSLMNKMISFGTILINKNKPIGNKSTMLIGSNGKWKLKIEKLTKYKDKRRDKCMKKNKKNFKSNKNFKNILEKFNFVIC